jgi:hypothetical protein
MGATENRRASRASELNFSLIPDLNIQKQGWVSNSVHGKTEIDVCTPTNCNCVELLPTSCGKLYTASSIRGFG